MGSKKRKKENKLNNKRGIDNTIMYPALKNTKEGELYGYINDKGQFIINPIYEIAYDFNTNGLAVVGEKGKFGLINKNGKYILKSIYDSISDFNEDRAVFILDNYMGVINEKGEIITDEKYNFIGDYKGGRAVIGVTYNSSGYKYGYIDLEGNIIIPPIYLDASNFKEGLALVKKEDGKYSSINSYGKIINTYNYDYVSQYGDGLMVFGESFDGPLGYINIHGKVVIKAKYRIANGFKDNVAVVSESDNFSGPYGLINKKGKYVYEPIFSDIKILGENRVALGMPIGDGEIKLRSIYAIGNTDGKLLTDFIHLSVGEYINGLAYASNEVDTFFIDTSGEEVKDLPKVSGSGELLIKGDLIYADIDYEPYYLEKSGGLVYKPNDVIKLNNTYSVLKEKYKPNINYLIYNPVVKGIKDRKVQDAINNKLKELSYFKPYAEEDSKDKEVVITQDDVLDYDYYGDFNIQYFKGNLLGLELEGYYYPIGAAHGMPSKKTPTINLVTGEFYNLEDLFMGGVYWTGELNKIIKNMIENDFQYEYVFKDDFKGIKENQDFYIDKDNLYIYFAPYEIGPYSAGFITFKIPFSEIQGIINKNGDFYKALQDST